MGNSKILLSLCLVGAFLLAVAAVIILSLIPVYIGNRSTSVELGAKAIRVAIIGAGISGLTAALTLADSNKFSSRNIFIYEANTVVGGRMHTRLWAPSNQTSEWCGEYIDSDHTEILGLAKRFDINVLDTIEATNAQYDTTFYFLNTFYNETQAWIDYQAIAGIIKEQLGRIGTVNYNQSNADGQYFDRLSLYDWIEQYVPGGHRSQLGQYVDSAYVQEYGLDTKNLSSLLFLFTISPETQPANGPLSIYGPSDQRYRMIGGNDQLPRKISDYVVERGVSIRFDHNLTRIVRLKNGKIRLTFENNRMATFDHVILTLPVPTLRYVDYSQAQFDPMKQRLIRELRYGTNTKLNLQFARRFWYDVSSDGVIYTDLPFLNSWEESLGQPGDSGILVLFTGGSEGTAFNPRQGFDVISNASGNISTNIYVTRFLSNLNKVWPKASSYYTGEGAISAPWIDKHYLGSYSAYTPGQFSTIFGYEPLRQSNVHFAGDYTSNELYGYMEGAIVEGIRAANEIIADHKVES